MTLTQEQRDRLALFRRVHERPAISGSLIVRCACCGVQMSNTRTTALETAHEGKEKATPGSLSPKIRTEVAHTTNPIKGIDYV